MAGRVNLKGTRTAHSRPTASKGVELAVPMPTLQVTAATVDVISLGHGRIRSVNLHELTKEMHVDRTIDKANAAAYEVCCCRATSSLGLPSQNCPHYDVVGQPFSRNS